MPAYQKRTGEDVTDNILLRLGELEDRVARLNQSPKRTTFDRGDIPAVAAPFEGQTMVQYADNSPYVADKTYFYANGQWHAFTSTLEVTDGTTTVSNVNTLDFLSGAVVGNAGGGVADITIVQPTTSFEIFVSSSASIAANTNAALSFAHSSGSTLMNYSTPTAPTFISRGLYAFVGDVTVAGGGTNNVIYSAGAAFASATYGNPAVSGEATGGTAGNAAAGLPIPLTIVGLVAAGDSLNASATNKDTIAQNFSSQFSVARLLAF